LSGEEIGSMTSVAGAITRCGRQAGRFAAAAALAASLTGCYTAHETVDAVPTDYRQRHPITLQEGTHAVEIFIGSSRGELAPEQRADVLALAQRWKREATGGIVIDVPAGGPNERAAADAVHEINSILTSAGVPAEGLLVRSYRPMNPGRLATIRLTYPRITAQAGPCGLWPHDLGPADVAEYEQNRPYWNLGCATQRNLAAMVDNPADLVQPRGETPAYEARRAVVLDKYRKGESTATNYPNENKGKISDVGN
jgi:pilus assembly protein CpaD